MSFPHYWGGLFAQFVTMLLSLLRFEAICLRRRSVSLRLGYGHFNTSNCFFFRHSRCPTRIVLQREATRLCFVFKRVLTPCFVDQGLCPPDFYLETQIKVGSLRCESPLCSALQLRGGSSHCGAGSFSLLHLERSVEMEVIASFLQMQGVQVLLQNASCHVLPAQNLKLNDYQT